jgi:hypothetical protein
MALFLSILVKSDGAGSSTFLVWRVPASVNVRFGASAC